MATATLLGYAAGLLFVVPLGDGIDRKWLMIASALVSCAILIVVPISLNLSVMLGASFALGFASVAPQLAVFVRVAAIAVRTYLMKNGPFIATVVPGFVASVSDFSASISDLVQECLGSVLAASRSPTANIVVASS